MNDTSSRAGGCACDAVRFIASGPPKRVGLCHCLTCRKSHATAFNPFVVYDRAAVDVAGETRDWESSPGYVRTFCPSCGSRVVARNGPELEISLGSFDAPGELAPQYEVWTVRREPWLPSFGLPLFAENRTT
jgi:hypothetical protein